MGQVQGNTSSEGGRLDGSLGSAVVAANFALGAGWGAGSTVAVQAGSTDQRGIVTVTTAGGGQAQATASLTLTFADGAYGKQPFGRFQLIDTNDALTTAQPIAQTISTTQLACVAAVLPVTAKTYKFFYETVQ